MNLEQYLMEHGILKNADAEKMAREIETMFGDRATKAEAACFEKDAALQDCSLYPLGENLHYKVCAALDNNTCGKGVMEKIERLRDELSRLKAVVGEVDIELIDQALEETK